MNFKQPKFVIFIFVVMMMIFSIVLIVKINPETSSLFSPCIFHSLTGLYCPGCGTTRAVHQLLNGNFAQAFSFNPLMLLLLPFLGYSFLSFVSSFIVKKPLPDIFAFTGCGWILFGAIVLFGILRNIPYFPFNLLAP